MRFKTSPKLTTLLAVLFLFIQVSFAQKTVTGTVTDQNNGSGIAGVTVTVKGTNTATQTDTDGRFSITAADNSVLVFTSVGFVNREVTVGNQTSLNVSLQTQSASLSEVVVIGYGTARRRDVTGSVGSVSAKDFNKGVLVAPDQLIQGKIAGVQVLNNSGQPGGETSVRIRGNTSIRAGNQPLYVVDGVPLSGGSARPGLDASGLGATPGANPLNFINPNDIASIDVLKDASATAIYGSRGANGVVIITTRKGQAGVPSVEFNTSLGVGRIVKQLDVLSANEYRDALKAYNVAPGSDWSGDVNAMDEITRSGFIQNYNVATSGGNENAKFRAALGYYNMDGIVLKSGLKKYTANLNGAFRFLESRRLGLDLNIITGQTVEQIAPVTTTAGFEGSLIGQALQWNPTRPLRNADGSINFNYNASGGAFPATNYNPIATSEAYDDNARTTNILASITPYFKFTDALEYRMILSLNYGNGVRRSQNASFSEIANIRNRGWAQYGNNEMVTRQLTHTLNYNKEFKMLTVNGTLGYEYMRFENKGVGLNAFGFTSNSIAYTNYFQGAEATNRNIFSFADPRSELQSYFGRANFNLSDKYLLTATMRADGSSKFGENNKYGYFPSLALGWTISNEDFMKGSTLFNNLKLRLGWGKTGNQEFPAGAAQEQYAYTGPGNLRLQNVANPNLKWETTAATNVGVDFAVLKNRLSGSIEYFYKNTQDLLFNFEAIPPAPASRYWTNLNGNVINSGVEVSLNSVLVNQKDLQINLGANVSFIHNELKNYTGPIVQTGAIQGQGLSGAFAQRLENGEPLNSFFIGRYLGLDRDGVAQFEGGDPNNIKNRFFVGSANPKTLLGITGTVNYKKLSLIMNMNGAYGHYIYNNTTQAALAIGNVKNNRNIASTVFNPAALEDAGSSQPVSSRYLEKGDYLKMANMTLSYNVGNYRFLRNTNIFITGQNLFIITNYSGFDPEVNTSVPINNFPSFGIEYTPYPSARTFTAGFNFTL